MVGRLDSPLSERGRTAAILARSAFSRLNPAFVVASDLARALDTATLATGRVDRIDARFTERDAGVWEGRLRSDLDSAYPGATDDDTLRPSDFEAEHAVVDRMIEGCIELFYIPGIVICFTHRAAIRALIRHLTGTTVRIGHLGCVALEEGFGVTRISETAHWLDE